MAPIAEELRTMFPKVFIHAIKIGRSSNADRLASFYDDVNRQVDEICEQLARIEELKNGFDAVGFSQGGQIMRAYVQRCNTPPVRNLITIGAQHQGVMDLPGCLPPDLEDQSASVLAQVEFPLEILQSSREDCGWWQQMVKQNIYADWVQKRIVQAQYFKDPLRYEEYLQKSRFLADINNDHGEKRQEYADRLKSLNKFVMFMFAKDEQVVPKESAWFGYYDGEKLMNLRDQKLYTEDWLGLRSLDERGALVFQTIDSSHVDEVCRDLRQRKELQGGFNAIGLSQGGLLFRALVEKCNGLRVNNLITLGSPLQGVAAYPGCGPDDTFTSQGLNTAVFRSILRKNQIRLLPCPILKALIGSSVYSESVQERIMPAQYFKDPNDIPQYLQANRFLADINNEHGRKNQRYKDNMVRLKTLVVFSFTNDVIVYPKESTNLGYFENGQIRPLRELRIYKEDWIGLKTLDQRKALIQIRLPGEHLDFNKDNIKRIVPYLTEA